MTKLSLMLGASAVAVSTVALTTPSFAQNDEIVITATKREQTLQDVPVSVSVTTGETIEQARIVDILDLQSVVPSLRVSQLQNSAQTTFIIRGFGNGANNAGVEPAVGVFIDGVYRSRSAAQISDLPKVERVEVLRGPQSTLFGKNASAGVISVVSAKPSFEWDGYIEGGISNYDGALFKGYVTGPISDRVAFSFGASQNTRDGYTDNLATGNDISDRDRYALRGELMFEASDRATFRLIGDYDEIDEVCCTIANVTDGPTGDAVRAIGGQIDSQNPFSYNVFQNFEPTNQVENGGVSLQADIDVNENITLTSITAYRTSKIARDGDVDFTSADLIGSNAQTLDIDTFTQEVRLASNYDGPVNWLGGLYYFDESFDQTDSVLFGNDFAAYANILAGGALPAIEALSGFAPGTFQRAGDGVREFSTQDNQAYSLFGQVDWELSDRLTATLGLSYTNDEKDVTLNQINTDVYSSTDLNTVNGGAVPAGLFGQAFFDATGLAPTPANIAFIESVAPGTTAAINAGVAAGITALQGLQFLPPLLGIPNAGESGNSQDDNVDYTVRLAYDVNDNINVYGSVSTGYKATSFNLSRDSRPTDAERAAFVGAGGIEPANLVSGTRLAGPEEATVYEIGLKAKFDKGSINVAVFDQTIEGFQANIFTGAAFTLANAGEQSVQGFEFDTLFYPTENIVLGFSGTFLDPVFDSFTGAPGGDLSGTQPGGIHEVSLSTSVTWNWDRGPWNGFIRADHQYEDEIFIQNGAGLAGAANRNLIPALSGNATREVSLVNASLGVSKGNMDLTLWGRNLFEDEYLSANFPSVAQTGSFSGYPNQPRTYGVNLRFNLGE